MNTQKTSLEFSHFPVMLNRLLKFHLHQEEEFIDCTFGGGGYSKELLKYPKLESLESTETHMLFQ